MIYFAFAGSFITDTDVEGFPGQNEPYSETGEMPCFPRVPGP